MFAVTSFSINGYAQTEEVEEGKKRVYCELVGTGNLLGNKMKVSVDFGQRVTWLSDQQLVDENGKKIKFNSMVDAMNYMGRFKCLNNLEIFLLKCLVSAGTHSICLKFSYGMPIGF